MWSTLGFIFSWGIITVEILQQHFQDVTCQTAWASLRISDGSFFLRESCLRQITRIRKSIGMCVTWPTFVFTITNVKNSPLPAQFCYRWQRHWHQMHCREIERDHYHMFQIWYHIPSHSLAAKSHVQSAKHDLRDFTGISEEVKK